uniref:Uncharacterized protein n=1 Tax=Strombidium rassoulzadegani TaxID=1082188 RepID=A0A7S3FVN0_9SPIT|mmetsp:Transcript_2933/g.4979  ORF Transcript_2933/g.4979 Transcript_2933/m.4979 type:complete len:107 (+) Transcript_2933:109-429(+)
MTGDKSLSYSQKLSNKEKHLLSFLDGTDTSQLLTLSKESQTRKYGELATMNEDQLCYEICRYLNLGDPQIQQEGLMRSSGGWNNHSLSNVAPIGNDSELSNYVPNQ